MTMIRTALIRHLRLPPGMLGLCLSLLLAAPAAAQGWLRADTPNFVIYSDGYPHELRRWAKKVEMYDSAMRSYFGRPGGRKGARLTIYMLKDDRAVARIAGQSYLAGLYSPSSEGSYAVTNRKPTYFKENMSGQQTLFHEYAHHFMYRHFPAAYPVWYREGFAEYVATVEFDADGYWKFGLPAIHRRKHFAKKPLAIETILFTDVDQIKAKRRSTFYAWSWLLVHMLNTDGARDGQLRTYLDRFGAGEGARSAAKAFGDLGLLESQLRAYANSAQPYRRSANPVSFTGNIRVTTLGPVESLLAELRLMRRASRNHKAPRDALRKLARTYPRNAEVFAELALAERDVARKTRSAGYDLAETAVDRALSINPLHVRANILKAELTIRRLSATHGASPADWNKARLRLIHAARQSPDDPLPYLRLFSSYSRQGKKPPQSAHRAIARAFALQPESSDIRLAYAFSLAMQGKHDRATRHARVLASDPHAAKLGRRALVTLDRMRKADAARAGPKPAATQTAHEQATGE